MALAPVSSAASAAEFGLDFQSLLSIILTQLTYQDPLKPVENFEFVSQLAQFAQLQQSQTLNDQVASLLSAQAASQATALLGRTVEINSGVSPVVGVVEAISFATGAPTFTLKTSGGQTIANLALANVAQVR